MQNHISNIMERVIQRAETCTGNGVAYPGVPTGYTDLDEKLAGFQPGELILLAGRPSMGKTSLALNFVWNIASKTRKPVVAFSCDTDAEQLARSIMSRVGRINTIRLKRGLLHEDDWQNLMTAFNRIAAVPIYITDHALLDIESVLECARKVKEDAGPPGLIVIDDFQMLPHARGSDESISFMLKKLKLTAKVLNVPVLVLAELSRVIEDREDKRPILSDIPNHDVVVPQCDVVLSIYRDEVYNFDSNDNGVTEIRILKQNNGGMSMIKLYFHGEYARFDDMPSAYTELQL